VLRGQLRDYAGWRQYPPRRNCDVSGRTAAAGSEPRTLVEPRPKTPDVVRPDVRAALGATHRQQVQMLGPEPRTLVEPRPKTPDVVRPDVRAALGAAHRQQVQMLGPEPRTLVEPRPKTATVVRRGVKTTTRTASSANVEMIIHIGAPSAVDVDATSRPIPTTVPHAACKQPKVSSPRRPVLRTDLPPLCARDSCRVPPVRGGSRRRAITDATPHSGPSHRVRPSGPRRHTGRRRVRAWPPP
jgi:hypothetical protein